MLNRLIIIGNGFDLAHGLKTRYSDFIDWYWTNLKQSDELVGFSPRFSNITFTSMEEALLQKDRGNIYILDVTNTFFRQLNEISSDQNWVDIEMFYYQKLKDYFTRDKYSAIEKLNKDFDAVKRKFEDYIKHVDAAMKIEETYCEEIADFLLPLHDQLKFHDSFLVKLPEKLRNHVEEGVFTLRAWNRGPIDTKTMILNFNYTRTLDCYSDALSKSPNVSINHIHGKAGDQENQIIFGFGDERDDLFDEMEKQNKNEFLQFMKSSFYLQNRNYFDLQNFLQDKEYVVEIFGHSCALSDRTLLKTIFEHPNCAHIFLTYHSKGNSDNFMDLSLNMSRHFDDKKLLRSRVSNKTFCKKFPQKTVTPSSALGASLN